jgi:TPP-dependent pyruvate/acetoin dehydrogenase alpha subunit
MTTAKKKVARKKLRVFVVERKVQYEGADVIAIRSTMKKANSVIEEIAEANKNNFYPTIVEVDVRGCMKVSISDISWTTIPWDVE